MARVSNVLSPGPLTSPGGAPIVGQASAPPPDDAGYDDIIITGRRRGPWDYLRRLVGDLGSVNFPAAGTDFDGLADTSGMSAPIKSVAAYVRNLEGDIDARKRGADSAFGEARYDLSHRSLVNTPLQNLWLDSQAIIAGGKGGALREVATPLGLFDGTIGAGLNLLGGGQGPSGLVTDDYYTNGLLKVAPAFAGVPEAALAETGPPDIEALFEANSLRVANETHELFHQHVGQGIIQLNPNLPLKLQAGRFVDDAIRLANLRLRDQLGLASNTARINQRLYDAEGRYTVPDIISPNQGISSIIHTNLSR
ncbi:MAG TPA: hypothetical protein VHZ26_01050 [Caulobacteraceae bacterium]|jgi:hypothetical protein|nr:hypothetical protein [Caulobacteraceae bacterium]